MVSAISPFSCGLRLRVDLAKSDNSTHSVICIDTVIDSDDVVGLPCLHFFHSKCFDGLCAAGITRCPLCKRSMVTLQEDKDESESREVLSSYR